MSLHHDLRTALRALRHSPFTAMTIVFSLAFGLAVNLSIAAWVDAMVSRPLTAVPSQQSLVVVDGLTSDGQDQRLSYPEVRELSARLRQVAGVAAYTYQPFGLSTGDHAERVWGQLVTANFFEVLQVRPAPGRGFVAAEEVEGAGAVAVISDRLWRERFGRSPDIIGQAIEVNGHRLTIVGIAPARFHGVAVGLLLDVWIPVGMQPVLAGGQPNRLNARDVRWLGSYARLDERASLSALQSELNSVAGLLAAENRGVDDGARFTASRLADAPWGGTTVVKPVLRLLRVLTAVLVIITCANVANLLLVRGLRQRREVALRVSLGASRVQIARQILVESSILALLAGTVAAGASVLSARLFVALLPPTGFPIGFQITMDGWWLANSLMAVAAVVVVVGAAPVFQALQLQSFHLLREESASVTSAGGRAIMRRVLVAVQVAMCVVLLVTAGALATALRRASAIDPGFDTQHVLLASIDLSQAGYTESRGRALLRQLGERLRVLPSVSSASFAQRVPLDFGGRGVVAATVEGYVPAPRETVQFALNVVGPDYLRTLGIALVAGREFSVQDDDAREPVAIVNQRAAATFWPDGQAIDRFVVIAGARRRIVGIAADIRQNGLTQAAPPALLVPALQVYRPALVAHVSTVGPPASMASELRDAIRRLDPAIPVYDVRTMREHMMIPAFPFRLGSVLAIVIGAFALLLAVLGVYAAIAHTIYERRREVAIRSAIGASRSHVMITVIKAVVVAIAAGLAAGVSLMLVVALTARNVMEGVSLSDPIVYAAAFTVIVMAAAVAIVVPLYRVLSLNAAAALK